MSKHDEKYIKVLFEKTFGSPDGQELLKYLMAEYVEPEIGMSAQPHQFYYLAGQKDLVLSIFKMTNYTLEQLIPEVYDE